MTSLAVNACRIASDCENTHDSKCCDGFCLQRLNCDGKCEDVHDCTAMEACCFGGCIDAQTLICCENNNQCDNGMRCNHETYICEEIKDSGKGLTVAVGLLGAFVFLCFVALRYYIRCKKPRAGNEHAIATNNTNRPQDFANNDFLPPLPPYSPPSDSTNPENIQILPGGEILYTPRIERRDEYPVENARSRSYTYPPPDYAPPGSSGSVCYLDAFPRLCDDPMLPPPVYTPQGTPLESNIILEDDEPCEPPPYEVQET